IASFAITGVLYTVAGGISSVIWTEVIQTAVLLGAVVAALAWLLLKIPAPVDQIIHTLATTPTSTGSSKLTFLRLGLDPAQPRLGFDPSQTYTLLTAIAGFTLLNVGSYGADHDLVQRMLTCRTAARGSLSA